MKQLFYVILILGLIYFCYWYITKPDDIVVVNGSLTVLEDDSNNPPEDKYKALIHGTAKNVGSLPVKEVWITYKIGSDVVNAYINEIQPNNIVNFRTGNCQTEIRNPEVEFIGVRYNE